MAEMKNPEQAQAVFGQICQTLDAHDWKYQKNEEKLMISCSARGDDLPMELNIRVDAQRSVVVLFSHMPFAIQEDKRLDVAVAITVINNALADGCFDYNIADGNLYFRMSNSFEDSTLSQAVFAYMLFASCQIIDEYNDKFLMLAKGLISVQDVLAALNN
ncbi:MAG: hypothetical protein E7448_08755 [Ruminococcaceae bacterium]|nr:hypothetical protein [Oscillospiraceae bacterium]